MKRTYKLYHNGDAEPVDLDEIAAERYEVAVDGEAHTYTLREIRDGLVLVQRDDGPVLEVPYYFDRGAFHLLVDGHQLTYEVYDELQAVLKEQRSAAAASDGSLTVAMPGRVIQVAVSEGDQVTAGDGIVVVEAMKMENELKAPVTGVVKDIHVSAG